jgi:hypothetical protein
MVDERFALRKSVRVQQNRVMRSRPLFRKWSCTFTVEFDTEVVNTEQVIEAIIASGRYEGFGDWRPKYGRFEIVKS